MDADALLALVDRLATTPLRAEPPCWVHGDLYACHLLVDAARRLCGVIDWGDCCIGSPVVDLAIVTALSPSERGVFFHDYSDVDRRLWRHARLIAAHMGAALLASNPSGFIGKAARRWLGRLIQDGASLPGTGAAL